MRPATQEKVPHLAKVFWRLPTHFNGCYTSAAPQDGFDAFDEAGPVVPGSLELRVLNSLAAGRRSALRAVACQAVVGVLVSLAFLVQGPQSAASAGIAGGSLVLGSASAAMLALGAIVNARVAFARLLLGMLVKWCVVIAAFVVALGIWHMPPVPMLVGLAVGVVVYSLALNWSGPVRIATGHGERTKD